MLTQKQQKQAAKAFYQHWKDKQGYEKGETQAFWNMLLRDIFGVAKTEDIIEYEKTVQSKSRNFIDAYIAPTKILIEQKSADKDLLKPAKQSDGSMLTPYQQAKRYADELPLSAKPRYIIACNFREFHIHDMEKPQDAPQIVLLKDLQKEYHRLSFIIDNHSNAHIQKEVELSIEAGKIVGLLYDAIARQYKDMSNPKSIESLNKLCVRLVFCLYAEDTDIFHAKDAFRDYLLNHSPQSMRQALIDLFTVLNTPQNQRQNLYLSDDCLQFPYANGGLFTGDIEIPLMNDEIYRLITTTACEFDWSEISPTIFGAVFESTLNPETRRSGGMHYTSIENIHKVIDPLFLDDLKDELAQILQLKQKATIMKRVAEFQHKLASLTFLDPAAGSGNFLTETYISLRHIENQALAFAYGGQKQLIDPIKVSISQFYGIEINDFAVSVAQTALWIAEIQSKHQTEEIFSDTQIEYLPLKTHATFVEGNALRIDWNSVIPASELNYIMGNPPFVGYSLQNKAQKDDLLSVLIDENGKPLKTAGKVDYVAGWYYKACGYMQGTNIQAAFVSTNSICQGEQPAFVFKHLKERYQIQFNFAYRTFRWDSEAYDKAAVHCVIIGFSLSGSLKNNRNAVGWVSNPPTTPTGVDKNQMNTNNLSGSLKTNNNTAEPPTVIASEQSERGNLPATENAPNNNNDKAVGWAFQPTTTPTGVDNTNIITDNANIDFAPNGAMVGKDAHPTTEQSMTENLSGSLKTNNNTTTSVILSDSEESLSNNRDSSLATQVQNDEMFSGSLKKQKIIYDGDKQITAKNINAYLIDAPPDILIESRNKPICNVTDILKGSIPVDDGNFFFTTEEKEDFLVKEPKAEKYIRKFYGAREFLHNEERWCLWLINATPSELKSMPKVMERIKRVQEFRLKSTKAATRKFADYSTRFMEIRQPETNYLLFPSHSSENRKYIPIGFEKPETICGNANLLIPNADLYMFGVLTSSVHMAWMRAVAGRLEMRYRYSGNIVYNNFIWCEPDTAQKAKIEHTAQAILDARANYPTSSLADLYDELTMPPDLRAAHKANDTAVLTAYGLPKTITEEEIVAFLMQEYQKRTSKN
ncbi:MAG: hypothetical protein J6M43_05750 [Neisseriaceae bacterium]|nr:hypothetical protein [Neisseriaceae bacterium]